MVKHFLFRIIGLFLFLSFSLNAFGCDSLHDEGNYTRINGKNFYHVTDKEKLAWKDPLIRLMEKAFLLREEQTDSPDFEWTIQKDESAIAMSYGCGLLDITMDGVPELLVHPFGYFGSSGTTTYFIYDIVRGKYLGQFDGGNAESFCFYYDINSENIKLIGHYWLRCGWDYRDHFLTKISFDPQKENCKDETYLSSSHEIVIEQKESSEDGTEIYMETLVCSNYSIYDQPVELDLYDAEYRSFEKTHIRIPETELLIIRWDDVADGEKNSLKIKQMAEALLNSDQTFLKP